ncbi:hypothetical protein BVRB_5g114080 [Beta vulgaris subsp. vulgaris]|nr:hypothetical protein BVRB_5g114080 [Beta vulgaris subsp. vulgaris]
MRSGHTVTCVGSGVLMSILTGCTSIVLTIFSSSMTV